MKFPESKLVKENEPSDKFVANRGFVANHPFIFWALFGIIILLSGIAIWGKWGFNYSLYNSNNSATQTNGLTKLKKNLRNGFLSALAVLKNQCGKQVA